LTLGGNLGIAKTNPDHKLHVVGTSTVTGDAFFGNDVNISGNLIVSGSLSGNIFAVEAGRVNQTSGVSTVARLQTSTITVAVGSSIGIGITNPTVGLDAQDSTALFGSVGIGTTLTSQNSLNVSGTVLANSVGIGTTSTTGYLGVYGNVEVYPPPQAPAVSIDIYSGEILTDNRTTVGLGTTSARSALDFSDVGKGFGGGNSSFMIIPRSTNAQKVIFGTGVGGIGTSPGAIFYNTTNNEFEGYNGGSWTNLGITTSNINANQINVSGVTTVSELKVGTGVTINSGIVTATDGFLSGIGTAVKITTSGNQLIFTVPGVGSTSFTLS